MSVTISQLIATGEVRAACWAPSGDRIAFLWYRDGTARLWTIPAEGGFPVLLSHQAIVQETPTDAPQWSPRGDAIAYISGGAVWTVPAGGGTPVQVTKGLGKVSAPRWSPDGRHLAFLTDQDGYDQIAIIETGEGGVPVGWPWPLVRAPFDCRDPQWSPNGSRIAFTALQDYDDHPVYVADVKSGELSRLSPAEGCWTSPRWHPAGDRLYCLSDADGYNNLWLLEPEPRQITRGKVEKGSPAISRDGSRIIYTVNRGGYVGLAVLDLTTGVETEVSLAPGVAQLPAWSPAGDPILFLHETAARQPEVFIASVSSSGPAAQLTFSAPAGVVAEAFVKPALVAYASSDGLEIPAFLYKPPQAERGARVPAIVYPHGGPTVQHDAGWYPWIQYFAQKGYAILAPNFRGSTGYGRDFELANKSEWGKKDLEDVLAGAAYLRTLAWVDSTRIGIHGGSYGGYQVLLALSKAPGTFCCGVGFYGVSNRFNSWRDTDRIGKRNMERKLGKPAGNRELYQEASPLAYAANINAPLMLMHGEEDKRVPFGQSVELVEALKRLGIPVEFHAYPGEAHGFANPKHLEDIYTKVERFFALYL